MKEDFLLQKAFSRKVYGHFEMELTRTDSIFLISIHSLYSEYIDIHLNPAERTLTLTRIYEQYALPADGNGEDHISFDLPGYLAEAECIIKRTSRNIFLVFHLVSGKKNSFDRIN